MNHHWKTSFRACPLAKLVRCSTLQNSGIYILKTNVILSAAKNLLVHREYDYQGDSSLASPIARAGRPAQRDDNRVIRWQSATIHDSGGQPFRGRESSREFE
jgi:hypothetical protein